MRWTTKKMRWLLASTIAVASMGVLTTSQAATTVTPAAASSFPVASEINWNQYKGKVVMVDFWASWCGPCRDSFPWMKRMQAKYGKEGLVILAVNVDHDPKLASQFVQQYQPNFAVLDDHDGKLANQFKVQGMPSSYVLDRNGQPAAKHQGFFQAKQASYEADLQRLLGSASAPHP